MAQALKSDAREAIAKASKLDPKNPSIYLAQQQMLPFHDFAGRQNWVLKGLQVAPNDATLNTTEAEFLHDTGQPSASVAYIRRALVLDPLSPPKTFGAVAFLGDGGQLSEAREMLQRATRIWPTNPGVGPTTKRFAVAYATPAEGAALIDGLLGGTAVSAGEQKLWRNYFQSLACKCGAPLSSKEVSAAVASGVITPALGVTGLARLGQTDAAFELAQKSLAPDQRFACAVLFSAATAPLRKSPRFLDLAARCGLVDYWRASGRWPEFCSEPGSFDCKAEAARVDLS